MDKYGYTLNRKTETEPVQKLYRREDLELMSTHQLRDICRKEKIIGGVIDRLDKEELVRMVLRFRGVGENLLIKTQRAEGLMALDEMLETARLRFKENELDVTSRIIVFEGLACTYNDKIVVSYREELVGTNALVVSGDNRVCGIFNVMPWGSDKKVLYLLKAGELICRESNYKSYRIYFTDKQTSERIYHLYYDTNPVFPEHMEAQAVSLLNFELRQPLKVHNPIAIDFGTTNTTAGIYLNADYMRALDHPGLAKQFQQDAVNYTLFYNQADGEMEATSLLSSVAAVRTIENATPQFLFGYEAEKLAESSYIDEGFCVFYDLKRWVIDYEKEEELIDRQGHCVLLKRKDIIRAYLKYVITQLEDQFKCKCETIYITSPVKQKALFQDMLTDVLQGYQVNTGHMIDEGVAVLYHIISEMLNQNRLEDNREYKALIMDCGGGTTDFSSCVFRIQNRRVSYQIDMETAYENGDSGFGGNNLTYRILQLIKIAIVCELQRQGMVTVPEVMKSFDLDIYRFIDERGTAELYQTLEETYEAAEAVLPTRFRDYENSGRKEYYKVRNNYYYLFGIADSVKKQFYNRVDVRELALTFAAKEANDLPLDRWKLSWRTGGRLEPVSEFADIQLHLYDIDLLLKGEVYGIIAKFMERLYQKDLIRQYSFIRLTGQSCKMELFRDALKEFVPGKMIRVKRKTGDLTNDYALKLTCVDGALKYLKDKQLGFTNLSIQTLPPVLPYLVTAFTHTGEEVVMLDGFQRVLKTHTISRNLDNVELKLYLKDQGGNLRYSFSYICNLIGFQQVVYEDIAAAYGEHIAQKETDSIVDQEVKFFVWPRPEAWGYELVPVYRREGNLYLGTRQFYSFENEGWLYNFYDGTK